ncbi:MAG: hypothetical protein LQ343_005657 [Gyalolechia ehrenbergii]|nr:MAG: hypothetical protein LQ343_005657 [Gyalolechia ehrenbergii]
MSYSHNRTFSFNDNDESALNGENEYSRSREVQVSGYSTTPSRRRETSAPDPPAHRSPYRDSTGSGGPPLAYARGGQHMNDGYRNGDLAYSTSNRTTSTTTPGIDNMAASAAGGGIAGIAFGVANTHERESGVEALSSMESLQQNSRGMPPERGHGIGSENPYIPEPPRHSRGLSAQDPFVSPAPSTHNPFEDSRQAPSPGRLTPAASRPNLPAYGYRSDGPRAQYSDNPYSRFSTAWDPRVSRADIDPNAIHDDGDDGVGQPLPKRRSMLGLRSHSNPGHAAAGGAAAGGVLGTLGSLVGRNNPTPLGSRDASGHYGPVGQSGFEDSHVEKSEWLSNQTSGRKRLRWIVWILIGLIIIAAIIGGVIGGIKASKNNSADSASTNTPQSAAEDDSRGDLDRNSDEIKKLMNNPDLHRVFPGVDYTPYATQYPDCMKWPPSQNNVTRDVAVLSQLTNAIRLYGTDCNQTEMVLHAIDKLGLTDVKVWLGVWLDGNTTTNARSLASMNDILSTYGADPFLGVIVGNEVLYRDEMTETELAKVLADVKKNMTALNIDLPLATSDLGDDWTAQLASEVDVVMSNIHPFFAGKTEDVAASWTWNFWNTHVTSLTANTKKKNIISEVGWPSEGGKHCGEVNCTAGMSGAVAGIDEMNTFMDSFVCQSLANGTDFFWFEAFDEPWKKRFNEPEIGKEWEDRWGLMDLARKLKPGVKIPDCGGKTVSSR